MTAGTIVVTLLSRQSDHFWWMYTRDSASKMQLQILVDAYKVMLAVRQSDHFWYELDNTDKEKHKCG